MWARTPHRVESLLWELDQSSRNQRRSDLVPSTQTICLPIFSLVEWDQMMCRIPLVLTLMTQGLRGE